MKSNGSDPKKTKSNSDNIRTSAVRKILGNADRKSNSGQNSHSEISKLQEGDYYRGIVKILRKVKPGPMILTVFDGSASIDAIIHDRVLAQNASNSPSSEQNTSNSYELGNIIIKDSRKSSKGQENGIDTKNPVMDESEIDVDDTIEIEGKASFHKNRIEILVDAIFHASMDFEALIHAKSAPVRNTFSIQSERYESMKKTFIRIAQRIRFAIIDQQPILLRHHHDADGICAGLAVEQAILNVMAKRDIEPKNRLYRSPSVSPFYDQIDLFRDISKFNSYSDKFGDKSPLILLLDTGSTPENIFPLKVLESFEIECIIIDHHNPGEILGGMSAVCEFIDLHLNPYLFGYDSQTCGGMLCYELARFIDEDFDNPIYPAVAAIGDRCDIPEVDRLIVNSGMNREELLRIAVVIDYLSYFLKFDAGDGVYQKVFNNPDLVDLIYEEANGLFQVKLDQILPSLNPIKIEKVLYIEVNLDLYSQRGKFPTPGKILGLVHDYFAEKNSNIPVFTAGYFSDGVIIRATQPVLPIPDLLVKMQTEISEANVDGGGHEQAGSLKFLPAHHETVKNFIKRELEIRNG